MEDSVPLIDKVQVAKSSAYCPYVQIDKSLTRKNSANHNLINPLGLYVVYSPIWNLPATFFYCGPVTVLEWNTRHDIVLPPVAKLESLISHRSCPQDMSDH